MRHASYLGFIALLLALLAAGCDSEEKSASDMGEEVTEDVTDETQDVPDDGDDVIPDGDASTDGDASDATEDGVQDTVDTSGDTQDMDVPDDMPMGMSCRPEPFDVGATFGTEIVVATDGSDQGGDGSAGAPYATLERAAQDAGPGTQITVEEGTYNWATQYISGLAGTEAEPIRIIGNGNVVFDGSGQQEVLHFSEPRYVVLENLEITGSNVNGLNIDDGGTADTPAGPVVLRNLRVHTVGTGGNNDCIKLSGLDDFFIIDSEIYECDAGDAIDMVGCHDGFIWGNTIRDTPAGGIQAKGGSSGTLITGNRFVDVQGRSVNAGGSTGLQFFRPMDASYEAANLKIVSNVFVRSGGDSGAPIAYVGCDACVFANNTVVELRTWLARILQETTDGRFVPCRDGLFINNIVEFNVGDLRNGVYVNVGGNTSPETFTFANNAWNALDDANFTAPNLTGGIPPETGTVVGDAMLDGNYRTPADTALVSGQGTALPEAWPDFDGQCFQDPPSIGAFEVQ